MTSRLLSSWLFLLAVAALLISPFGFVLPIFGWLAIAAFLGGAGAFLRFRKPPPARPLSPVEFATEPEVETLRAEKDRLFKYDPGSPLTMEQRADFKGLRYFPIDPAAAIPVTVETFEEHPAVPIPTSTGQIYDYLRWGEVRFDYRGQPGRLTVFRADPDDPSLFIPFADRSSGLTTYGAGRYLELGDADAGETVLDFNRAYNPYCAYNSEWSCPLPPAENRLPFAVEAGEMTYPDHPNEDS